MSTLKPDARKMKLLNEGLNPHCKLEVKDEVLGETAVLHFSLRGKFPDEDNPWPLSSVEIDYWVGSRSGRSVCLQAVKTNYTLQRSFSSRREKFDNAGYPHLWTSSAVQDGKSKQRNVTFRTIESEPKFDDHEAFTTAFPSNYTVSDMTSGSAAILQMSHPGVKVVYATSTPVHRRAYIVTALVFLALLPVGLYCAKNYRRSKVWNSKTNRLG